MKNDQTPFDVLTTTGGFTTTERLILRALVFQYEAPENDKWLTCKQIDSQLESSIAVVNITLRKLYKAGLVHRVKRLKNPEYWYKLNFENLMFHKLTTGKERGGK